MSSASGAAGRSAPRSHPPEELLEEAARLRELRAQAVAREAEQRGRRAAKEAERLRGLGRAKESAVKHDARLRARVAAARALQRWARALLLQGRLSCVARAAPVLRRFVLAARRGLPRLRARAEESRRRGAVRVQAWFRTRRAVGEYLVRRAWVAQLHLQQPTPLRLPSVAVADDGLSLASEAVAPPSVSPSLGDERDAEAPTTTPSSPLHLGQYGVFFEAREQLGALLAGYCVRCLLRCRRVASVAEQIRETTALMEDLRLDTEAGSQSLWPALVAQRRAACAELHRTFFGHCAGMQFAPGMGPLSPRTAAAVASRRRS